MAAYKVQLIGRIPIETHPPDLPSAAYPFGPVIRPQWQDVDVKWPLTCPCCDQPVDGSHHLLLSRIKQSWTGVSAAPAEDWKVPYCQACLNHAALKQQRPNLSILIEITAIVVAFIAVFATLPVNAYLAAGLFLAICALGFLANRKVLNQYEQDVVRAAMDSDCSTTGPALSYQGWNEDRTRHAFIFQNRHYAEAFAALNQSQELYQVK